jgi:hypothetical protein
MTTQGSHWEGCWRTGGHHQCAIAEVERLSAPAEGEDAVVGDGCALCFEGWICAPTRREPNIAIQVECPACLKIRRAYRAGRAAYSDPEAEEAFRETLRLLERSRAEADALRADLITSENLRSYWLAKAADLVEGVANPKVLAAVAFLDEARAAPCEYFAFQCPETDDPGFFCYPCRARKRAADAGLGEVTP